MRAIKKVIKVVGILILSFAVFACDDDNNATSRSFYMGFTPFPYDISVEAVNFTYDAIAADADIINHHFDNGVPWTEAVANESFHTNIMNDWSYRKNSTPAGHKVYVSVAPLSVDRNGLANYRGEEDDMPLQTPWNIYQFDNDSVKTAYLNYCKRIIDFFNPDFFNMAIEANLLYYNAPDKWIAFLTFHEYIYDQLKITYPGLVIFSSVTGAHIMNGYLAGNDFAQQRLAALQIIDKSDLYAISFYPFLSNYLGNPYPENTFDELFTISDKPLAIAETGYPAQTFVAATDNGDVTIQSDPVKQNKFTGDLLEACTKYNAKFVINFVLRDYDLLWEKAGTQNDIAILWRDTGLYDESGNKRTAHASWKQYLSRALKPQ